MRYLFFSSLFLLAVVGVQREAQAVSVCYNNVCGQLVCQYGCVQRSVNGVCVANYCTQPYTDNTSLMKPQDRQLAGYCVSCRGGCCASGWSFLEAERACKALCGSFGCFTRCQ